MHFLLYLLSLDVLRQVHQLATRLSVLGLTEVLALYSQTFEPARPSETYTVVCMCPLSRRGSLSVQPDLLSAGREATRPDCHPLSV